MNFEDDSNDTEFRAEARSFVTSTMRRVFGASQPGSEFVPLYEREPVQRWMRALDDKGWAVPHWPPEWGGTGWPRNWHRILAQELLLANAPLTDAIGIDFVAPVLYTFGTQHQKQRYLPRIRTADEFWCQGFSEAEAGSDVMSLRTSAVLRGDHYVVKGRKLWTTNAHNAEMMFALVRIETPGSRRHPGLSFLLIDMRSPGILVQPIKTIDGRHWINEVELADVRVPTENLVGEPGKGWLYARFLLGNERARIAGLPVIRQQLTRLKRLLAQTRDIVDTCFPPELWQRRLKEAEIELDALEMLELRVLQSSKDDPGTQSLGSILKLRSTELRQTVSEFTFDAYGARALESPVYRIMGSELLGGDPQEHFLAQLATGNFLFQRSATIAGGTSEIQRNIIAAVALGL